MAREALMRSAGGASAAVCATDCAWMRQRGTGAALQPHTADSASLRRAEHWASQADEAGSQARETGGQRGSGWVRHRRHFHAGDAAGVRSCRRVPVSQTLPWVKRGRLRSNIAQSIAGRSDVGPIVAVNRELDTRSAQSGTSIARCRGRWGRVS